MTTTTASTATAQAPALPTGRRQGAAAVVAVLLLIASGFAAWQAILVQRHHPSIPFASAPVSDYLARAPWNSTAVQVAGIVLAGLGLWLLLVAVIPPRGKLIALRETDTATSTGIRRADLVRALNLAAESIDGVASARTRLSRTTATVTLTTPLGRPGALPDRVHFAVLERLRELDPVKALDVTVALAGKDRS